MQPVIEDFNSVIPVKFKDLDLLKKVFVHRSFLNERDGAGLESNERLEFLGDAILSNVISHILFEKYPEMDEGKLTGLRAKLVNRQTLARAAVGLRLNDFILLGKGERNSGGAENVSILAGAFEALIAAIYFEAGYKEVFSFIGSVFLPMIDDCHAGPGHFDFKPRLQELTQRVFKEAPVYRTVSESGPPHKKVFEVEVVVTGEVYGAGTASKRKDAEQSAAGEALKRLLALYPETGT